MHYRRDLVAGITYFFTVAVISNPDPPVHPGLPLRPYSLRHRCAVRRPSRLVIAAIPLHEARDALLYRRGRLESYITDQIVDVGISGRHIAAL